MSGRRRTGALASAIELAGQLMIKKQEHDEKLRDRAQEMYDKFQLESKLAAIRRGTLGYDASGQLVPITPPTPDTTGMTETGMSFKDAGGVSHSYAVPKQASPTALPNAIGKLPLTPGAVDPDTGAPKALLDMSPDLANGARGVSAKHSSREYLGSTADAVLQNPSITSRPEFANTMSQYGLGSYTPQLRAIGGLAAPQMAPAPMPAQEADNGLPDPDQFEEGDVIRDDASGEKFQLVSGQWVPYHG